MPAQRDERGRFIPGSGGGGSGGGGSPGGGSGGGGAGPSASGANAMSGAFAKALGASRKLAGGIKELGSAAKSLASGAIPSTSEAFSSFGSAAGGIATGAANALGDALAKLGPVGEAAGAAVKAFGEILGATIGTLADFAGIAAEVIEHLDLMRSRFSALAGSAAGGKAVEGMVDRLSTSLPQARSQIEGWTQSMLAAGKTGKDLENSVNALASAQALMGDSGAASAQKFMMQLGAGDAAAAKLIKDLQGGGRRSSMMLAQMGLRTSDLAAALGVSEAQFKKMTLNADQLNNAMTKALQKKGKGPLEDLGLTLPAILQKAREGFLSLFEGLGGPVKAFMKAVKSLFSEFNRGGAATKGLKPIFTAVLTSVFKYATAAVKAVHELVQGFMKTKGAKGPFAEIGGAIRKIVDAAGRMISAFERLNKGKPSGLSSAFSVLSFIIEGVAEILVDLMNNAAAAMSILDNLGAIVDAAGSALSGLADGAMSAAGSFIDGIVNGITSGAGAVYDAVANLASGALSKFKSMLGIASPSKVMMKMGGHVADGAAQGLDAGAGRVEDSAASLGAGVKSGAAKGMAGAGGKGKGGGGITINGGVHIEVPMGTPSAWAEEAWASFMERLAASQGAA